MPRRRSAAPGRLLAVNHFEVLVVPVSIVDHLLVDAAPGRLLAAPRVFAVKHFEALVVPVSAVDDLLVNGASF